MAVVRTDLPRLPARDRDVASGDRAEDFLHVLLRAEFLLLTQVEDIHRDPSENCKRGRKALPGCGWRFSLTPECRVGKAKRAHRCRPRGHGAKTRLCAPYATDGKM